MKNRIDKILERRLAALQYCDPETLLQDVLPTVQAILQKPDFCKSLPPKKRKECLEKYQAAFLGFMMKHSMRDAAVVTVCLHESEDFDCVLKGMLNHNGKIAYKPVQLKQLPSHKVNKQADIQKEIIKLQKYGSSPTLSVAFWINRDIKLDLSRLVFDSLSVEQLWFFGESTTGDIMLHGGIVSDLRSGICWAARMENGKVVAKPWRFRPREW
jgi:hypothetical protein